MDKTVATTAVVSAVVGGVLGGAITYFSVNKALRKRYAAQADMEIASVKTRYALLNKDGPALDILAMAESPSEEVRAVVEQGRKLIAQMGYSEQEATISYDVDPEKLSNIFDDALTVEDMEPKDDYVVIDGEPFLISEEAYFENEPEYQLDTLTYYAGDDTLADEANSQIERVDQTVGVRHLHMFNTGGKPKTSLYIQNDDHDTLYEVILIEDSFAAVIYGMGEEELGIKAPKARPLRMRDDE